MNSSSVDFDPLDPGLLVNPYPVYDLLREGSPVLFSERWGGVWFVTRYEDCRALLRDDRLGHGPPVGGYETQKDLHESQSNWFLFKNPPDHTRLRGLVQQAFTARRVEHMTGEIQCVVDCLLDRVQPEGELDVISDLAVPLPVTIIARLLGVPEADLPEFRDWSQALARIFDMSEDQAEYDRASLAAGAMKEYIKRLADKRRAHPRDDLLSALVAAKEAGDNLTEAELCATCILLLFAGHETTANLIGNGVLALQNNPTQLERLKADPALIRSAVEELLRYDCPVQSTTRTVLEGLELDGRRLSEGQKVKILLGAANRDPARFVNPGDLDISRANNRHLAFGVGIHYCLGAALARLEGEIAIGTLLRRMPDLVLVDESPAFRANFVLRGLQKLTLSVP